MGLKKVETLHAYKLGTTYLIAHSASDALSVWDEDWKTGRLERPSREDLERLQPGKLHTIYCGHGSLIELGGEWGAYVVEEVPGKAIALIQAPYSVWIERVGRGVLSTMD